MGGALRCRLAGNCFRASVLPSTELIPTAAESLDVRRPAPQAARAADSRGFSEQGAGIGIERASPTNLGLRERNERRGPVIFPAERSGGVEGRAQIVVGDIVAAEK